MKIVYANNFYLKLKGLMFQKNINYGMYFTNTNKLHTFFMRENIDIIGLNSNNIICDIYQNVKPNKIIILQNSIHTLELPANSKNNYKIGDKINLDIPNLKS